MHWIPHPSNTEHYATGDPSSLHHAYCTRPSWDNSNIHYYPSDHNQ